MSAQNLILPAKPRILIAACPRSGTMTMAHMLQAAKFDIKHEKPGSLGTVDWHEIAHYGRYTTIVHQVREPLATISSLRLIAPSSCKFIAEHLHKRNYAISDNIDSIAFYVGIYLHWNHLISQHATWRYRIEDISAQWPKLLEHLGLPDTPHVPTNPQNSRSHKSSASPVTWTRVLEDAPHLSAALALRAKEYGYEIATD
jgi:hypothetical protein